MRIHTIRGIHAHIFLTSLTFSLRWSVTESAGFPWSFPKAGFSRHFLNVSWLKVGPCWALRAAEVTRSSLAGGSCALAGLHSSCALLPTDLSTVLAPWVTEGLRLTFGLTFASTPFKPVRWCSWSTGTFLESSLSEPTVTAGLSFLERKMRFRRTESGRKKRAPKHRVTNPDRNSRKTNFWDRRSPMPDAETPGNFRSTI